MFRLILVSLLAGSSGCKCVKRSPDELNAPAFSLSTVAELRAARGGAGGLLAAVSRKDAREEAISFDAQGKELWHSASATHVLLGPSVFLLDASVHQTSIKVLAGDTGQLQRSFDVARTGDTWLRDDASLFMIEARSSSVAATLVSIDPPSGTERWAKDTGMILQVSNWSVMPALPLFTPTSLHLFCKPLEAASKYQRDLCRFSRVDGALTKTFEGPIDDVAQSMDSHQLYLLRNGALEALTDEGDPVWKYTLPPDWFGKRVAAGNGWLAVIASVSHGRDVHQERVIALDAADGHELWSKESSAGGEHFDSELALGGDRVVFVSNLSPQLRVLERGGKQVFGTSLETEFIVSTEAIGGFVEGLQGVPVLAPPFLGVARKARGLEVFRIP